MNTSPLIGKSAKLAIMSYLAHLARKVLQLISHIFDIVASQTTGIKGVLFYDSWLTILYILSVSASYSRHCSLVFSSCFMTHLLYVQ